jgi:hypothetical protein
MHSLMARAALIVGLLLPVALFVLYRSVTRTYDPPPGTDLFSLVQGTWAWANSDSTCASDPQTISFTPDRTGMIIRLAHPYKLADGTVHTFAYYDILRVTRSSIRGAIRGETRLTPDGRAVVWDLILESRDRFAWHRTDWQTWERTRDLRRCPVVSS